MACSRFAPSWGRSLYLHELTHVSLRTLKDARVSHRHASTSEGAQSLERSPWVVLRTARVLMPYLRQQPRPQGRQLVNRLLSQTTELRAIGDVLCDQFFFMIRCGFSTLQPHEGIRSE